MKKMLVTSSKRIVFVPPRTAETLKTDGEASASGSRPDGVVGVGKTDVKFRMGFFVIGRLGSLMNQHVTPWIHYTP